MAENAMIRTAAKRSGVYLWEIAEGLGVSEFTLSRRLRRELPPDETARIMEIIGELAAERKEDG